ncbi:MAG: hypothetical protein H0W81_02130 [Chloroflexi bacterium]|nr:hypothetical protein [Chloroflexota bacterium]
MTTAALIGWAIVGWCGTPFPRHWPWPPPPPPDGDPWIMKVIGIVGGIAGGWAFGQLFGADLDNAAGLALTMFGAWSGSNILNDAYGMVRGGQARG